jgi:hypothetical protein
MSETVSAPTDATALDANQSASANGSVPALEDVVSLALQLSSLDKIRLMERIMPALEQALLAAPPAPSRSLYGALAHLGPAPSAEEIDEARREAWAKLGDEDNLDG